MRRFTWILVLALAGCPSKGVDEPKSPSFAEGSMEGFIASYRDRCTNRPGFLRTNLVVPIDDAPFTAEARGCATESAEDDWPAYLTYDGYEGDKLCFIVEATDYLEGREVIQERVEKNPTWAVMVHSLDELKGSANLPPPGAMTKWTTELLDEDHWEKTHTWQSDKGETLNSKSKHQRSIIRLCGAPYTEKPDAQYLVFLRFFFATTTEGGSRYAARAVMAIWTIGETADGDLNRKGPGQAPPASGASK